RRCVGGRGHSLARDQARRLLEVTRARAEARDSLAQAALRASALDERARRRDGISRRTRAPRETVADTRFAARPLDESRRARAADLAVGSRALLEHLAPDREPESARVATARVGGPRQFPNRDQEPRGLAPRGRNDRVAAASLAVHATVDYDAARRSGGRRRFVARAAIRATRRCRGVRREQREGQESGRDQRSDANHRCFLSSECPRAPCPRARSADSHRRERKAVCWMTLRALFRFVSGT